MRSKKMLSFLAATTIAASAFAGFAVTSSAASLDDAKTITADLTYWFDDANGNGTTKIEGNTVFGEYFFTPYGHNAATNKGKTTIDGVDHFNSLRVKSATQDRFAFKVGAAATITFYTQSQPTRGVVVTAEDYKTAKESQTAGTTEFEYSVDSAQTIYVTAFGGDFFIAGVSVDITGEVPAEPTTAPTEGPTTAPTEAPSEPTTVPEVHELTPVAESKTWTQADFAEGAYTETTLSKDATLEINGEAGKAINVDSRAIKLGGSGSVDSRNIRFIPTQDGTVKVTAINGKASETDRYFAISVDGKETASDLIDTTNTVELTAAVKANVPVYIYSKKSGVNVLEIAYTAGAALKPEPVEASKDDAQDIEGETDGSVASLWNVTAAAEAATKVKAVVTDIDGLEHPGEAELGTNFTGEVQVYVVVNHAKADINSVKISFE